MSYQEQAEAAWERTLAEYAAFAEEVHEANEGVAAVVKESFKFGYLAAIADRAPVGVN